MPAPGPSSLYTVAVTVCPVRTGFVATDGAGCMGETTPGASANPPQISTILASLSEVSPSANPRSASEPSKDFEALGALIDYVRPRLAITDYVECREGGFVISSGITESTCEQSADRRLKGSGRPWSEAGALATTGLIAQRINTEPGTASGTHAPSKGPRNRHLLGEELPQKKP